MDSHVIEQKQTIETDQEKLFLYLKLLGDRSKYKIVLGLMNGEECVCDLAERLELEQTLVSHHLRTLRKGGLVKSRKVGKWIHYSLNKTAFEGMNQLYHQYLTLSSMCEAVCDVHAPCRQMQGGKCE